MSQPKPTIILVPGAFHKASHFHRLAMFLTMEGFTVSILDLPSTTNEGYVPHVYDQDVATIRDAIREFINVDRIVVLVMHGYAGIPGTQAAYRLGEKQSAEDESHKGGSVVKLIYLSAWLPMENQDLLSLKWPTDSMSSFAIHDEDERFIRANEPREQFYNGITNESTLDSAVAALEPKIMDHDFTGPENCAWREIPTAYIQCENDRVFPLSVTNAMIRQAESEGVHVQVEALKTCHAAMLSMPKKTCQTIISLTERT